MLVALEDRFLGHVSRGETIPPSSKFVANARALLAHTSDASERAVIESDIAVSVFKRGVSHMLQYIDRLRDTGCGIDDPDAKKLIHHAIGEIFEAKELAGVKGSKLHRGSGTPDKDESLLEMMMEVTHIPLGLNPKGAPAIERFKRNRLRKIASAWDAIDLVHEGVQKVIAANALLSATTLPISDGQTVSLSEHMTHFADAAKSRANFMKVDPEYYQADVRLRASRLLLNENKPNLDNKADSILLEGPERFLCAPMAVKSLNQNAYELVKDASKLMYDMSKIRGGRPTAVEEFQRRVDAFLAMQQSLLPGTERRTWSR